MHGGSANNFKIKNFGASILLIAILLSSEAHLCAQDLNKSNRKGLLKKIFSNKSSPAVDRESDTFASRLDPYKDSGSTELRENSGVDRYPAIPGYNSVRNCPQHEIEAVIDDIYGAYEKRIEGMNPPDLTHESIRNIGMIPQTFPTVWRDLVRSQVWEKQSARKQTVKDIYMSTLAHSNQVKVFSDIPLIRETGLQEADGEFDPVIFADAGVIRRNQPNGSTLTAQRGIPRFIENEEYLETGARKKFLTGAEATISNRWSRLDNNSGFLNPVNQGSSEMVISVAQPLMEGAGYHYNHSKIKIAKFDARMASAEFVMQLQSHLLEVNRAYWSLYYARAAYLLRKQLIRETGEILEQLEARADLDALQSEVLRARAAYATRRSFLIRTEMTVRNSEERLRALVNDPDHDIGSGTEMIPMSLPVLSKVVENVQAVAKEALHNRPEILQGFDQLRAAVVRRDMQRNEKLPTLNLVAELMLGDIKEDDDSGRAFNGQFGDPGYQLGVKFEQAIDNDEARARLLRREIELRQQANQLKTTIDTVLLEAVVSYRELISAYRDMLGKYETLIASREELRQLRERLEVDTEEEVGRTTASQMQLILDSMDRNQSAEETFLQAVVAYNAAFAGLDRAKGTILRKQNVEIERIREIDPTHQCDEIEKLQLTMEGPDSSQSKGRTYGNPNPTARATSVGPLIEKTLKTIETIPLEDLPGDDSGLMPLKPISPPSVYVRPLQSR